MAYLTAKKNKRIDGLAKLLKYIKETDTENLAGALHVKQNDLWFSGTSGILGTDDLYKALLTKSKTFKNYDKMSEIRKSLLESGIDIGDPPNLSLAPIKGGSQPPNGHKARMKFFDNIKRRINLVEERESDFQRQIRTVMEEKERLKDDSVKNPQEENTVKPESESTLSSDTQTKDEFLEKYYLPYTKDSSSIDLVEFFNAMSLFFKKEPSYILNQIDLAKKDFPDINHVPEILSKDFEFLGSIKSVRNITSKNSSVIFHAIEDIFKKDKPLDVGRDKIEKYVEFVSQKIATIKYIITSIENSDIEVNDLLSEYMDLYHPIDENNVDSFEIKDIDGFTYREAYEDEKNKNPCGKWIGENLNSSLELYTFLKGSSAVRAKNFDPGIKILLRKVCKNKTDNANQFNKLIEKIILKNESFKDKEKIREKFLEEFLKKSTEFYGIKKDKKDDTLKFRLNALMVSNDDDLMEQLGIDSDQEDFKFSKEWINGCEEFFSSNDFKEKLFQIVFGWNNNIGEFYLSEYQKTVYVDKNSSRVAFEYCSNKVGFLLAESIKNNYQNDKENPNYLDEYDLTLREFLNYYDDYISGKYSKESVARRENYTLKLVEDSIPEELIKKFLDESISSISSELDLKALAQFCIDISEHKKELKAKNKKNPAQKDIVFGSINSAFAKNVVGIGKLFNFCNKEIMDVYEAGHLLLKYNFKKIGTNPTYRSFIARVFKLLENYGYKFSFEFNEISKRKLNNIPSAAALYESIYKKLTSIVSLEVIIVASLFNALQEIEIGTEPINLNFLDSFGVKAANMPREFKAIKDALLIAIQEVSRIDIQDDLSKSLNVQEEEPVYESQNNYETLAQLSDAADAVYKSNSGDDKYVFIEGSPNFPSEEDIVLDKKGRKGTEENLLTIKEYKLYRFFMNIKKLSLEMEMQQT